ncbi:50S ribosomal protein L13 [Candidatus Micrarchaeota archaeon]|nr:50S ribosomal protein L13 [Candidatus Micrarchaeota archaeon]
MDSQKEKLVIDGSNVVFGRLATQIAKKLMSGHEVHLINAEHLVIKGNPTQIFERYLVKRGLKNKGTPERSPVWSKVPHLLVKRMISGMLPHENSRGRSALKLLIVYTGNPKSLQKGSMEVPSFDGKSRSMTIKDLCKKLGNSS